MLRLACTLASTSVAHTAATVATPGDTLFSAVAWKAKIREPASHLADTVLPTLSQFGQSLGTMAGGLGCFALGAFNMAIQGSDDDIMFAPIAVTVIGIIFALALIPATVSTECEHLIDAFNELRKEGDDPRNQASVSQLQVYLKGCNREQGIGFKMFGVVINRQQLKVLAAKTWTVLVAVYIFVEPLLNPIIPELDQDSASSIALCGPGGWHYVDKSCFLFFGGVDATEWKTQPQAESACQPYGAHLASVMSQEQYDATLALSAGMRVWIGLSDVVEEENFVWNNGEPLDFTSWSRPPKNNAWDECEDGRDCVHMWAKQSGWQPAPCTSHTQFAKDMDAMRDDRWTNDGVCHEFRLPYICSKPASPTMATGGMTHGCINGGWMMGTAHNNPDLPPTTAFGVHNTSVYISSAAHKNRLSTSVTTPAECIALVRENFPDANAAEFSNTGRVWCDAVYNASGLIFDPAVQTCLFDDNWPVNIQRRRHLVDTDVDDCSTAQEEQLNAIRQEMENIKTILDKLLLPRQTQS
jgi:hypothetical protein